MANITPNLERRVGALAMDVFVRVSTSGTAAGAQKLAFVKTASYNEQFTISRLEVIGFLGACSLDPTNYSCSIQLDGVVPNKRVLTKPQYDGSGKLTILDFIPNREDFLTSDGIYKIPYMDFYNENSKTIMASFSGVVFESTGMSISPNDYVSNSCSAMAIQRNKE